ncbi:transposase-like protein [Rhizobium sp. BK538]|nr:transposase-like protein [Rhizobium sp. BK538]TCM73559.1 transposase IS481 family protein [Rhizobium sp. BK068]
MGNETSVMEEGLRFVARLLEGEGMSDVCREFGISRKTGYKIFNRYKDDGLEALTDRSRRPVRYANQLQLGDGRYCYPLTVTDQASHYLLACEAFESTRERAVFDAFGRLFAERGLPLAIRSDNGLPFASPNGALQSIEAVGLVAAARHRAGAHQAGPSARKRPGRW